MTKAEIRYALLGNACLKDILTFTDGQDCLMYKGSFFSAPDEVIYIPDTALNGIPLDRQIGVEDSERILSMCYTKADFLAECDGDAALAYRLFCYVDWQHPSSAFIEVDYDDEEDKAWAKELYAVRCKEHNEEVAA